MDEKQAITHLKRGDIDALEVLVNLYQLKAVRAACLIVYDRSLAEDIVQSAFIRAYERIVQFDDQRLFGPWFLRSVVNDALKAANRQKKLVSLEADDSESTLDLADPAPMLEELIETEDTSQAIHQALLRLSPNQRSAIVLRYYLGLDENEMAARMHRPAGTIKYWLHAARQRLRKLLHPIQSSSAPTTNQHQTLPVKNNKTGDKS
jgi:RNA polymerase sigma-70 factor (ECF subfamily)